MDEQSPAKNIQATDFDDQQLLMAYYFGEYTDEWAGVVWEDEHGAREITDAVDVFLLLPVSDEAPKEALCAELFEVIRTAGSLSGDELKNFVVPVDGSPLETGTTKTASPTVAGAVATEEPDASTPEALIAL
jgi:hypothetical protein